MVVGRPHPARSRLQSVPVEAVTPMLIQKGGIKMEDGLGTTHVGTIAGINGHPMSGLWMLTFEDGTVVHIASGFGVRSLAACFGAREGSGDLMEKIQGQKIVYTADPFNVMEMFTLYDEWVDMYPDFEIPFEGIDNEELTEEFRRLGYLD